MSRRPKLSPEKVEAAMIEAQAAKREIYENPEAVMERVQAAKKDEIPEPTEAQLTEFEQARQNLAKLWGDPLESVTDEYVLAFLYPRGEECWPPRATLFRTESSKDSPDGHMHPDDYYEQTMTMKER